MNIRSKKITLFIFGGLLGISFLISPVKAQAIDCPDGSTLNQDECPVCGADEEGGLVPCGRHCQVSSTDVYECCPCTLCHVFLLANRLILFARNAAFLVATILIVAGGAMMLLSGAYQDLRSKGKSIVSSAVTGLIIVLLAWVITASVLVVLVGRENAETYFNLKTASFKINCEPGDYGAEPEGSPNGG